MLNAITHGYGCDSPSRYYFDSLAISSIGIYSLAYLEVNSMATVNSMDYCCIAEAIIFPDKIILKNFLGDVVAIRKNYKVYNEKKEIAQRQCTRQN